MAERPTITGFQYREEPLASELDLANRLGEPVWVPAEWPVDLNLPEYHLMLPPTDSDAYDLRSHYQLRSRTDGQLLLVSGNRRRQGQHLESGLLPVEGEQFVTLTDPPANHRMSLSVHRCGMSMSLDRSARAWP